MGRRPDHVTDLLCLIAVAVLYAAILAANLFSSDRPTFSESEKRELASFPAFSVSSLADGSFFSGLSDYISDNFVGRDRMVRFSKRIETLVGIQSDLIVLKQENKSGEDDDVSALLAKLTTGPASATTAAPPPMISQGILERSLVCPSSPTSSSPNPLSSSSPSVSEAMVVTSTVSESFEMIMRNKLAVWRLLYIPL